MCPTSIAVLEFAARRRRRGSGRPRPGRGCRRTAASKSRPASTPRRCQPVRFAPATNCPSRSVSSATTSPWKPTGPSEPGSAPNAERISSSVAGRTFCAERGDQLDELEPVVAADEREHDRAVVGRRPASPSRSPPASIPRSSASASIVVTPGVSTSSGACSSGGNSGGARHRARDLEVGGEVAVLAGDERVLARARRGEEVDRLAAAHHPRLGLDRVVLEPAARRRSGGRRASCARKLRSSPSSSRSNE